MKKEFDSVFTATPADPAASHLNKGKHQVTDTNTPSGYSLNEHGQFQIDQYDQKPAFASFLPGIGGADGVPLWCLYVNRAQAISSFGIGNKDHAIVEFLPANWAYQLVGVQGFRTFCLVDGQYYEPFQNDAIAQVYTTKRTLWVEMDRLKLREENQTLGLRFEVCYFSPVNQPVGSLARIVTITNTSAAPKRLQCLDGLPLIIPAGFTDFGIKAMRRIHEAYAAVRMATRHVPFYAAKVMAHDEAEVEEVRKGNFYAAWLSDGEVLLPVEPYYDPDVIFGAGQDLITPRLFIQNRKLDRAAQVAENKMPCAMVPFDLTLPAGDSITLAALAGMAPDESMLPGFLSTFQKASAFEEASQQSRQLIRSLTQPAFAVSSRPALDGYARQNYLDNVLRGGIPKWMPSANGGALIHLYARRHGDAERDYNFFDLPACPLSSGEGNYRDICQNRRHDIWFYPETADHEIRMFVSLLQADGYNPLSIGGNKWRYNKTDAGALCPTDRHDARAAFVKLISQNFLPGQLLAWADHYRVKIEDRGRWLDTILGQCETSLVAGGHEGGYWIDHWTYIVDLLEAYQAINPDRVGSMLTANADIPWHCEPAFVADRAHKYLRRGNGPLQLQAIKNGEPCSANLPPVTVLGKLCALLAIKAVSLDYEGRGIEMEAGRPGWNDAMNGLPGLFGSSTCETMEAVRLARWLLTSLDAFADTTLPIEVAALIQHVTDDLKLEYDWDRAARIRENFRNNVRSNVSMQTTMISGQMLRQMLEGIVARFEQGIARSVDPATGLLHTYYMHRPVDARDRTDVKDASNAKHVEIRKFEADPLPLFLEGQVHWLRVCSKSQAQEIYKAVRKSVLVDQPLKMYKLNECLARCPKEIGRARTFSRGWFENESIWLHMSAKYLLELIKNGLYDSFFTDAETMLVPFMNPAVYGRSILENSSFIASSDCPDPQARGRGFVARLSGTTAEFIHIWRLLTTGPEPFRMKDGQLAFTPEPILPAEWFTETTIETRWNEKPISISENAFACALLGDILCVYHNPAKRNTYGDSAVRPVRYVLDGKQTIGGAEIKGALAREIRDRHIGRLDVWLE